MLALYTAMIGLTLSGVTLFIGFKAGETFNKNLNKK